MCRHPICGELQLDPHFGTVVVEHVNFIPSDFTNVHAAESIGDARMYPTSIVMLDVWLMFVGPAGRSRSETSSYLVHSFSSIGRS